MRISDWSSDVCSSDLDTASNLPRRTRLAIEALGPTFVKLGQILGTRGDLLAPEWIAEFEKLHSQAPTLPFDTLRAAVEERSEERRVGKECVSKCRSRWSPYP